MLIRSGVAITLLLASAKAPCQCPKSSDECTVTVRPTNSGNGTITTTRYDNHDRSETTARTLSTLTEAGLTYLLVTRPVAQRLRNEDAYRRDGQFSGLYELLDLISAESIPTSRNQAEGNASIKGNVLGNSWQTFLSHSPNLKRRAEGCAIVKRPDPGNKVKKVEFNPCRELWRMSDNPEGSITLDCLEPYLDPSKDVVCTDLNGEVKFEQGKLTSLKLVVLEDWSKVLQDVTAKFGKPDARDERGTLAIWDTKTFRVVATQVNEGAAVAWMSRTSLEATMERKRQMAESIKQTKTDSLGP